MIQAKQLSKSFGNRKVLRNLDLTLKEGEVVALVGLNGAGKTTLIRTLCGLNKPDSGAITIDGLPLAKSGSAVQQKLGVVLHASMLYHNLSCRENLEYYSQLYGLSSTNDSISELLELMDLSERSKDRVGTLSRGMQQRLSVARALLHDPAYLCFDEIFSGLDQRSLSTVIAIIQKKASAGKGILFSTHDLDKIFFTATRVDILHKGQIAFSEFVNQLTPQSLLAKYDELTNTSSLGLGLLGGEI